jgi:hypothetical protein
MTSFAVPTAVEQEKTAIIYSYLKFFLNFICFLNIDQQGGKGVSTMSLLSSPSAFGCRYNSTVDAFHQRVSPFFFSNGVRT